MGSSPVGGRERRLRIPGTFGAIHRRSSWRGRFCRLLKYLVHYYGAYANRCRSRYRDGDGKVTSRQASGEDPDPLPKSRASWARLLRMVFEVDPLTCRRCGALMKVISVITDPALIDKLLRHVRKRKAAESAGEDDTYAPRAPPAA